MPVIDFKYYPPAPKPTIQKPKEFMMQPIYSQPYYPQQPYSFNPFPQNPALIGNDMPQQLIHNIHISTTGPNANHEKLAMIYEDVLPITKFITHSVTLYDRLNLYQFIRSTILKGRDGEDTSFDGSTTSLLTKLKFGELNPYRGSISKNPYFELPNDYLIYRSCYPIKMNPETSSTQCGKKSCAINVRIYKMDYGSINVLKIKNTNDILKYEQLREIGYYEYIREEILKKKICPNFVLMFGYFVSNEINIDFEKINKIRGIKGKIERKFKGGIGPDKKSGEKTYSDIKGLVSSGMEIYDDDDKIVATIDKPVTITRNEKYYENCGLIILTESGTHSIISWGSAIYQNIKPNIRTMVYRGIHNDDEWTNIIFQIMVGLYVMIIKKIYIRNMTPKRNIFIKDVDNSEIVKTYWKYIIGDVEYYVPNMKYVVLIDSDYQDNNSSPTLLSTTKKYKIKCEDYFKKTDVVVPPVAPVADATDSENIAVDEYKEMITNIFNVDNYTGMAITEYATKLLNRLKTDFDKADVDTYDKIKEQFKISFGNYMYKYLHSRIGTNLTEKELEEHNKNIGPVGFGLALHNNTTIVVALNKTDDATINKYNCVNEKGQIHNYPEAELTKISIQLNQPVKFGEPMRNEENLLEIYEIKDK